MGCEVDTEWRDEPDGTRTCTYCGSLHPVDFTDILWKYAQHVEGYSFDMTDKGYKDYGHRPGVENASQGGIKFYGNHCTPEYADELYAARKLAILRWRKEFNERWGRSTE